MNFSLYIIGKSKGRYSQYPDDYTAPMLRRFAENMHGAGLAVHREMNLRYYLYTESIGNDDFFGMAFVFNDLRIARLKRLKSFCQREVESVLDYGIFLRYNKKGELVCDTETISSDKKEYERVKASVDYALTSNRKYFQIGSLLSTYNGTHTEKTISFSESEPDLLAATEHVNTVFITTKEHIEQSTLGQRMAVLLDRINALKRENESLAKQKKQYRLVLWVAFFALIVSLGAAILGLNLHETTGRLTSSQDSLAMTKTNLAKTTDSLLTTEKALRKSRHELDSLQSMLRSHQPFIVGKCSFNWDTKTFTFTYYGLVESSVPVKLRCISEHGKVHNKEVAINIHKGNGTAKITLGNEVSYSWWWHMVLQLQWNGKTLGGGYY